MRRLTIALALSLATAVAGAAVEPIDRVRADRPADDDLRILWEAPATPVDGYRVYRHELADCSDPATLVYEGVATEWTDAGAFLDARAAIYRVTAYLGTEESELSPPVYKFTISIPPGIGSIGTALISFPYHLTFTWGPVLDLCSDLNTYYSIDDWVFCVDRYNPDDGSETCGNCEWLFNSFDVDIASAYRLMPVDSGARDATIWGWAPTQWRIELAQPFWCCDPSGIENFLYRVTLPYDHEYPDLASIAAELPSAVEVRVWEPDYDCTSSPCPLAGKGLSRPTSSDPWTGTNEDLTIRRGEAVMIGVDAPFTWVPRQACWEDSGLAPRIVELHAVADSSDEIGLTWETSPLAAGGYEVRRVSIKGELATIASSPVRLTVAETVPNFPVVDLAVGSATGLFLYQVVGLDDHGDPGAY